jgi:hypothetical protein
MQERNDAKYQPPHLASAGLVLKPDRRRFSSLSMTRFRAAHASFPGISHYLGRFLLFYKIARVGAGFLSKPLAICDATNKLAGAKLRTRPRS